MTQSEQLFDPVAYRQSRDFQRNQLIYLAIVIDKVGIDDLMKEFSLTEEAIVSIVKFHKKYAAIYPY